MRGRTVVLGIAIAVMAAIAACGGGGGKGGASPSPTTGRPRSTGAIAIASPTPGQVVQGSSVQVKVTLTGAHLTQVVSTNVTPDEGHMHFSIDGMLKNFNGALEDTITGLTPGPHLLQVEFVAADHGPFNPRVIQTVTFSIA